MEPEDPLRARQRRVLTVVGMLFGIPLIGAIVFQVMVPNARWGQAPTLTLVPESSVDRAARTTHAGAERAAPRGGGATGLGGSVLGGPTISSAQVGQRLLSAAATTGGEVEVSLVWNSLTDLDLEVREPSGFLVNAHQPRSPAGGVQDVDANPTLVDSEGEALLAMGRRPRPENIHPVPEILVDLDRNQGIPGAIARMFAGQTSGGKAPSKFTRQPVEHIYFAQAPRGTYTVYAQCYSWREKDPTPLPFTVEVRSKGKVFHRVGGVLGPASVVTHGQAKVVACRFDIR